MCNLGIICVTLAVIRAPCYCVLFYFEFYFSLLFAFILQSNIAVPSAVSTPANNAPVVAGSTAALLDGLF